MRRRPFVSGCFRPHRALGGLTPLERLTSLPGRTPPLAPSIDGPAAHLPRGRGRAVCPRTVFDGPGREGRHARGLLV